MRAGLAGHPVCIAIQMVQMMNMLAEKNSKVNQSMRDAMLLRSVGSANAASVAKAGRVINRVLSGDFVENAIAMPSNEHHRGKIKWRLHPQVVH